MEIKIIDTEETYSIRHSILRKGKPIESCFFEGDKKNTTFHLGLFINKKLAGICTLLKASNSLLLNNRNQYQLRGMAILKGYQHKIKVMVI